MPAIDDAGATGVHGRAGTAAPAAVGSAVVRQIQPITYALSHTLSSALSANATRRRHDRVIVCSKTTKPRLVEQVEDFRHRSLAMLRMSSRLAPVALSNGIEQRAVLAIRQRN
jgi:hypothetical protein